ncbi:MAG: pyruvate dehydrogenase complex dihydrolipoamide acetyltransferase [Gemmatimonadota bacterium]
MATKVMMEALSPTMEEGRLVKWLKNVGDAVKNGETLAEVETDKAIMELVARGDGVLRARMLEEGGTSPVGQTIAVIAAADEDISALTGGAPAAAPAAEAGKTEAGTAEAGKAEAGTASPSAGAPADANAQRPPAVSGEAERMVPAGEAHHQVTATTPDAPGMEAAPAPASGAAPAPAAAPAPGANAGPPRSSPLARRLASERGIALENVSGTGPNGRIIRRDIEAAQSKPAAVPASAPPASAVPASAAKAAPAPAMTIEGDYKDVALTQMRKTIARRLSESIGPIPTFYLTAEIDMTKVGELRAQMVEAGDQFKVSVNDIIIKAVAIALVRHPEVNAHWMTDHIRYFARVNVGMAVATDEGLIVPVINDAHTKGLGQLGREARDLAKRARERKLAPAEYSGGTFSVSNLGMFGIDQFTAIINPPEAAILAVGSTETKPVWENGAFVPRERMRVTLSCDHRVIDGAVGARFLQTLVSLLERPMMMLF